MGARAALILVTATHPVWDSSNVERLLVQRKACVVRRHLLLCVAAKEVHAAITKRRLLQICALQGAHATSTLEIVMHLVWDSLHVEPLHALKIQCAVMSAHSLVRKSWQHMLLRPTEE